MIGFVSDSPNAPGVGLAVALLGIGLMRFVQSTHSLLLCQPWVTSAGMATGVGLAVTSLARLTEYTVLLVALKQPSHQRRL